MTRAIASILEVAREYDAVVLDQWGVLHDGSEPYPGAVTALERAACRALHLGEAGIGKRSTGRRHGVRSRPV